MTRIAPRRKEPETLAHAWEIVVPLSIIVFALIVWTVWRPFGGFLRGLRGE